MKKSLSFAAAMLCGALAFSQAACASSASDKFFIGGTGPLTGNVLYGVPVKKGAELAIEQINAQGGLNGIKFQFEMLDDEAAADKAKTGYNTLYSKGMQASIGSVTTASCIAFAAEAEVDNMFFITPSASSPKAIEASNAYRICFGDPDQGDYAYDYLKDKYTKIGVIYQSDDTYSSGVFKKFKENVDANPAIALTEASYTSSTKTNFSSQITQLKAAGAEAVFLSMYVEQAYLIVKEAKAQSFKPAFLGTDGLDGLASFAAESGEEDLVKGIKYITPFDVTSTDSTISAFVAAYKAKYNEVPDQFAADGYDAVMVIYNAMKTANVTDVDIKPSDLCAKITEVLQGGMSYKGATGTMTWNKNGEPVKTALIYEIK